MLKSRLIPCLDVKDGRVVKGVNFVDLRDAGDPVEAAKAYDAAGADGVGAGAGLQGRFDGGAPGRPAAGAPHHAP